ncbi:hypothetical protein [Desertibaculum subflavum]|uniref:hypothetical protein n=1 Tax=Desertibaculum subflavum TaxID=2268458 RepID=UPI000E66EDA2
MAESRPPNARPQADQRNEGEGNRTAARRYNAETTEHAKQDSKVRQAAEKAKQAMQSPERKDLTEAEKQGLNKARH